MGVSNYGAVSVIAAPELKETDMPAMVTFKIRYTAYLKQVADANKVRKEGEKIVPASYLDCVDSETLNALVIMGEIKADSVETVTAAQVEDWFKKCMKEKPVDISERIDSVLKSVKYKMNKADPQGGVRNFVMAVIKSLDQNNIRSILQDADISKNFLNELVKKLEPPVLVERVKMLRRGQNKKTLCDIKCFNNDVGRLAMEVSLMQIALQNSSGKRNGSTSRNGNRLKNENNGRTNTSYNDGKSKSHRSRPASRNGKRKSTEWSEPCLMEDCDGVHKLVDCPLKPSKEKIRELLQKHWNNKKAQKSKSISKKESSKSLPYNLNSGRVTAALAEKVHVNLLGDSGADYNAIDERMLSRILKHEPDLHVEKTDSPTELQVAFKTGEEISFSTSSWIVINVVLYIPGSNVPVRIRGVKFHIVNQDMDEAILGRTFLDSIGFNFTQHLEKVRDEIHNKHVDEIQLDQPKLANVRYQGLSYLDADDDPIELPECIAAGIGEDSKESIDKAFKKMLKDAKQNGISAHGLRRLSKLLQKYRNVFRIKLGADPPANVPPLVITPTDNAKPYRSPQRRYAPLQKDFLTRTIRELEKVGAIYKNPSSRWASPALAVPKPGSQKLRFTVDLRGPNSRTVKITSAMPHLESQLQDVSGSKCFATIDLAHGYWQIPLAPESQEMLSIQTPLGVYSSHRLLQGGSDSGNHFQAVLAQRFAGRVHKMLQWLDDFLFYGKDENELLDNIEEFLLVCSEIGVKIHAEKTTLFSKKVNFCGRIITPDGITYHPRHFTSITSMKKPITAADLQQFVCATNWMRNSIPDYAKRICPLQTLLNNLVKKSGKRTKQALKKFPLNNEWGATHNAAFGDIKQQLAASVELSHPKPDYHLCLFTDASDTHWAAILTQVSGADRQKDVEKQSHEPLCFLSGAFSGSAANWSVPEKEGFAIVESMCRLDYLTMGREVNIFTDHANLVYLYDPYGRNPGISRHTASKLMRWAIKLSAFHYVVEHLPGENNVWADMLTRWAVNSKKSVNAIKILSAKSLMVAPINPGVDPKYDWPNSDDIINSQEKSKDKPPHLFTNTDMGLKNKKGQLWIPDKDYLMKLRIMIAAHAGHSGHRSWRVTLATMRSFCTWTGMDKDVESFVKSCLHCLCSQSGKIVPRPLGHSLHAVKPNQLLHFDFCYMSHGEKDFTYVLVLKDDHSGYVWLVPTKERTAEVVSEVLIRWFSTFNVVYQWVSDRGSHFKNELVRLIREKTKSSHHFTLAYCPWSNGTVEVVNRELLRATRALLSEYQLAQGSWPSIMPVVQSVLNNTILERLGNRCPLTVMTALPQDTPLLTLTKKVGSEIEVHSIEQIRKSQVQNILKLHESLDKMHKEVAEKSAKKRDKAISAHNRKTNVRPINFTEGDFVLRGVLVRERSKKPSLKWTGPFRVVECRSDYIFVISDLLTHEREQVHGRRLKFFSNKSLNITEEILEHLQYQKGELLVIESFTGIRRKKGVTELQVKWRGFDQTEMDWVSIKTIREDVPVLLSEYLQDLKTSGTHRERQLAESS